MSLWGQGCWPEVLLIYVTLRLNDSYTIVLRSRVLLLVSKIALDSGVEGRSSLRWRWLKICLFGCERWGVGRSMLLPLSCCDLDSSVGERGSLCEKHERKHVICWREKKWCRVLIVMFVNFVKTAKFVNLDGWRLLRVLFGGSPTLYAGSCPFLLTAVCVTVWGGCPFPLCLKCLGLCPKLWRCDCYFGGEHAGRVAPWKFGEWKSKLSCFGKRFRDPKVPTLN